MITGIIKSIDDGVGLKTTRYDLFPTHVTGFAPFCVSLLINLIQKGSQ